MNNTTMSMPLNQTVQTIKMECKTNNSINIPYFFSIVEKKKTSKILHHKKQEKKEDKKN